MKYFFLSSIFCWIFSSLAIAQSPELRISRSNIGTGGGSFSVASAGQNFTHQNCLGQIAIQTFSAHKTTLQQGFLQGKRIARLQETGKLSFTVAPNPFADFINVNLAEMPEDHVLVTLSDAMGRQVCSASFLPAKYIRWRFDHIPTGFYTLTVQVGSKSNSSKLIQS